MTSSSPRHSGPLLCGEFAPELLHQLLGRFGLHLHLVDHDTDIPGSYWGAPEAGIRGTKVFVRDDTPIHSLLHEACHILCMPPARRATFDTEAGGDDAEENAVCYLQILLADYLEKVGRDRLMADMDDWGYSFRLGSTKAWFEQDAEDAREWLVRFSMLDGDGKVRWRCREAPDDELNAAESPLPPPAPQHTDTSPEQPAVPESPVD